MLRKTAARWWRIIASLLICAACMGTVVAQGSLATAPDEAWANPSATAIKNIGQVSGPAIAEDNLNLNYDCMPQGYRLEFEPFGSMHTGCFTPTAFGQMDVMNNVVQGFGFSGAIPVKSFGNQAIVPLPRAAAIATVSGASPMGSHLHLYTYFPNDVQMQYDFLLHPYLQLPQQANIVLSGPDGQPLIINAQTLAYSTNGSWMVVESPWHSFLRINTATMDMLPFAPSFSPVLDYAQHDSQVAITDDGRYAAIYNKEFGSFKVYDLATCSGTISTNLAPLDCQAHNFESYISGQISGLGMVRHLRFVNDGLLSFHTNGQIYELAPADSIKNLLEYLALGDSYTAGEGAFNYATGTDTSNNMCHQSVNSYPYLLTRDLFTNAGGHSVACSGALTTDITSEDISYPGQVKDEIQRHLRSNIDQILSEFSPGYIAQHEFVSKYQPRIVTVSVGGNDIGFADIIKACVTPHAGNNTCYSSYEDRKELANVIDRTYPQWLGLYQQLQSLAPDTRIYAIGYPQIAAPHGNCAINVHLNEAEVEFSQYLLDYLNSVIQKAATDAGVTYIDISHALDGHRLCEATGASVAMNGLTAGTDKFHVFGNESYHPNALGQELIEQAILRQVHGFTDPKPAGNSIPAAPQVSDTNPLLNAPKTGRNILTTVPNSKLSDDLVVRGQSIKISVDGIQHSLQPNSYYKVVLRGSGTVLGSVSTNGNGDIDSAVTVPATTPAGSDTLDVNGTNLAGQPIDITKVIYVASSEDDTDGDEAANNVDSCPAVPNSGQDTDADGIDDACDGFIGPAPTSTNSTRSDLGTTSTARLTASTTLSSNTITAIPTAAPSMADTTSQRSSTTTNRAVLGTTTEALDSPASPAPNPSVHAVGSLRTIHWLPWGIDVLLIGLLLTLLSTLFERLAKNR